jgi:hypothetical protein
MQGGSSVYFRVFSAAVEHLEKSRVSRALNQPSGRVTSAAAGALAARALVDRYDVRVAQLLPLRLLPVVPALVEAFAQVRVQVIAPLQVLIGLHYPMRREKLTE